MKWKLIIVGVALGWISAGCHRTEPAPPTKSAGGEKLTWLTDFDRAQTQAREENKMLLILFTGSDWCPPCIMLERQVFSQPKFAEYAAQNLVLLEVDFPRTKKLSAEQTAANEKLAKRFGIYGFPTVIVLDSGTKKIGELGYMPGGPDAFIAALNQLRAEATTTPLR